MSVPQLHPGKVLDTYKSSDKDVVSAGTETQAMVNMWDGHTLTLSVHPMLRAKIRAGDIVLVDYYPSKEFKTPLPKMQVARILRGQKAEKIVEEYRNYFSRVRKVKREGPAGQVNERYIG